MDGPEGRCRCLWMLPKESVGSLPKIEEVAPCATPRSPDVSGRPAACGASWARERRGILHEACRACPARLMRGRRGRRQGRGAGTRLLRSRSASRGLHARAMTVRMTDPGCAWEEPEGLAQNLAPQVL